MDVTIPPSEVRGSVRAPPSKSYTHRAVLAAGFSKGATITTPLDSADPRATGRAVKAFGGDVEWRDGSVAVWGFDGEPTAPEEPIDCANSGTTMRLATAAAALADGETTLTGDASLRSRPQGPLLDAIEQLGGTTRSSAERTPPVTVVGPIEGGRVSIPGDVSSQFVTALLMAGGATEEGITVNLESELRSAPYVDMTIELLDDFGVTAGETPFGYRVLGDQAFSPPPGGYAVPGDFSSMSYLLAAGAVAGDPEVTVEGAHPSEQGDAAIVDVLDRTGADVTWNRERGFVTAGSDELHGIEVSVGDTPDLLPTIAAVGAAADGTTRITDCAHVRHKETDRVSVMAEELGKLGASVTEHEAELVVHGDDSDLRGTTVDGHGDHRVVMSLAVAALAADGRTTIRGADDVEVSFPTFFDAFEDLDVNVRRR